MRATLPGSGHRADPQTATSRPRASLWTSSSSNGGCSSWTLTEKFAHRFSGASRGKVGLVVRLVHGRGARPFIAAPSRSQPWFNDLYGDTMGRSFRFNEQEYAIQGSELVVEVARIKR